MPKTYFLKSLKNHFTFEIACSLCYCSCCSTVNLYTFINSKKKQSITNLNLFKEYINFFGITLTQLDREQDYY